MIPYALPEHWLRYDTVAIADDLMRAKASVLALQMMPFQRRWVDALQQMELKREVAGTSRIEGAEFTERELDVALRREETTEELYTRSQKQARAALAAYDWIKWFPLDKPVDEEAILTIHRKMVTNADDDHCDPGVIRRDADNVNFGSPRHRGCEGGEACERAFGLLAEKLNSDFRWHDPLVQAVAVHFHLASMHPFSDGNGRTARALEALMLRRAGLRDETFIAMSNYYYDEKNDYLASLAAVRAGNHDLTPFLKFALKGVDIQARRLLAAIQREIKRELYRNLMHDLFNRLESPKKRVIAKRQIALLTPLIAVDEMGFGALLSRALPSYGNLKNNIKAVIRDIQGLRSLGMVIIDKPVPGKAQMIRVDLDWPSKITETEFFERVRKLPTARAQWKTGIE